MSIAVTGSSSQRQRTGHATSAVARPDRLPTWRHSSHRPAARNRYASGRTRAIVQDPGRTGTAPSRTGEDQLPGRTGTAP
jgi:hypothetical protein